MHSIVVYPRNAVNTTPHVVLEPANYETFNKALEEMGKDSRRDYAACKCFGPVIDGFAPSAFDCAGGADAGMGNGSQTAASLVPFLFVGAWNSQNDTDKLGSFTPGRTSAPMKSLRKSAKVSPN